MNAHDTVTPAPAAALAFGPFRLHTVSLQLYRGDEEVRLGGRALALLTALASRPGDILSRSELEAQVWPCTVVEESSRRVHVAALRRVLGEGVTGARYIANVPGRGYSFVAPVTRTGVAALAPPLPSTPARAGRVNNLPTSLTLAIEFAASRIGLLGLQGVYTQLGDRLRLLGSGRRTALPRHRTLSVLLDWSYDLLAPDQQALLRRCGVFKGGFSLEAADAVIADAALPAALVHDCLMDLVAKSLVRLDLAHSPPAYSLLEITRAYALELLGRDPARQAGPAPSPGTLALATQESDVQARLDALYHLFADNFKGGDYLRADRYARQTEAAEAHCGAPERLHAGRVRALAAHYLGEHDAAAAYASSLLAADGRPAPLRLSGWISWRLSLEILMARLHWIQGRSAQATALAAACVRKGQSERFPAALSQALCFGAISVALWQGEDGRAADWLRLLDAHLEAYPQAYFASWATHVRQVLALRAANSLATLGRDAVDGAEAAATRLLSKGPGPA